MTAGRCYCQGQICGHDTLTPDDRQVHFDARVDWGKDDARAAWSGSYDFGSFACISRWALDRSDDHDGRVLSDSVDMAPVDVSVPPVDEQKVDPVVAEPPVKA